MATSSLFTEEEQVVLEYAAAMTITDKDVSDEIFARLHDIDSPDALVELTEIIAWENASSTFNRALRIPSQGLWKRQQQGLGMDSALFAALAYERKYSDQPPRLPIIRC